ncbi:MAG TPA: SDR family oxidoreductase [Acidimicrobiales bacterium]|nr:SDR family oxidoreductase [Acidimicrobiales bacterium]
MGDLTGVRVVVTGATSGLGAAMANALLLAGATVAFASRPTARLDASVNEHRDQGLDAVSLPMDVRDHVSVQAAVDRALECLGGIDVVVNNAGIGMGSVNPHFLEVATPFFEVTPEGFRDMVATDLTGYFLVARAFTPLFIKQGHGRFINVTANHETMRRKGFVPYGPARAGAEALSLIMVEDLRPYGITVNLLLPGGASDTGIIPDEVSKEIRKNLLRPEVMGAPILFLASPEAHGLTGERIVAKDFDVWLSAFRNRSAKPA